MRQIYDSMLRDGLNDAFSGEHSGWHTEDLVTKYRVTREDQDRWAARSQQRFSAAQAAGKFKDEIVAIELSSRKGPVSFDKDEANRPDTTIETLAKLKPAFRKDGTITAGNAPGLNSGAAAMIVAERRSPRNVVSSRWHGSCRTASLRSNRGCSASGRCRPCGSRWSARAGRCLMFSASKSTRRSLRSRWLACANSDSPEDIVNVEGGSIAHGHPIGGTGAVLTTRLLHSMQRDGLKRGIVTLCIGGGQGIALALETL